jgi:hypothetical protein
MHQYNFEVPSLIHVTIAAISGTGLVEGLDCFKSIRLKKMVDLEILLATIQRLEARMNLNREEMIAGYKEMTERLGAKLNACIEKTEALLG